MKHFTAQAVENPKSPPKVDVDSYLWSPPALGIYACLGLLVATNFKGQKRKGVLARGQLATDTHKAAARKEAMKLIKRRRHNEVALYIQTPEGLRYRKKGKKTVISIPEDPQTLYFPNMEAGTAAIGATGSGKSYSLINRLIKAAFDQHFPVIYFDLKYTDKESPTSQLIGIAKKRGYKVNVFAPSLPESCIVNPVDLLANELDAEIARQFALVLHRNFTPAKSSEGNPFFPQAAQKLIQGLMMLAKMSQYPDLMMCRSILKTPNLADLIEQADIPEMVKVVFDTMISSKDSPETFASIVSTVSNTLGNLMTPNVLPAICGKTNMPLDLEGRQLLIFGVNGQCVDVVLPIIATVLHLVVNRNVTRPRQTPLILGLDEIPSIFLPALDDWLNQRRSAGLCTILGFQSMEMLEKLYTKPGASRILGGCTTQAIFQLNESESAKLFAELPGSEDALFRQRSRSSGRKSRSTTNAEQRQTTKLVEPNEIATFPRGKALIFSRGNSDGKNVRVPLVENIVIPQRDIDEVNASVKQWPKIRQELIERSAFSMPTNQDFRNRDQEVYELLKARLTPEQEAALEKQRLKDAEEFRNL